MLPRVGPLTSPSLSTSSSLGKTEELDLRRDVGLGCQGTAWAIVPHPSSVDSWHFHSISSPTPISLIPLSITQVSQVVAPASSWSPSCHTATGVSFINSINFQNSINLSLARLELSLHLGAVGALLPAQPLPPPLLPRYLSKVTLLLPAPFLSLGSNSASGPWHLRLPLLGLSLSICHPFLKATFRAFSAHLPYLGLTLAVVLDGPHSDPVTQPPSTDPEHSTG